MTLTSQDFNYVRELVNKNSAIVLEDGKEYLVESRLAPLLRQLGASSIAELVKILKQARTSSLHTNVVEALTTNETSFFRDKSPFDALESDIIPNLIKSNELTRTLKIWSAACSSGQEAYSIALLLREKFPILADWKLTILGTDINTEILARAKGGIFTQLEVSRGLPAAYLVKYFKKIGREWQLQDSIRTQVEFKTMNLAQTWTLAEKFDVVFLRNVLIYFSNETKRQILAQLKNHLRRDGWLFLGSAETPIMLDHAYERVKMGSASCYRLVNKIGEK